MRDLTSITGQLAQDGSSNYEPCASTVPFQAQCNPHDFYGPAALVLSAFWSVQGTICVQVDQYPVTRLTGNLGCFKVLEHGGLVLDIIVPGQKFLWGALSVWPSFHTCPNVLSSGDRSHSAEQAFDRGSNSQPSLLPSTPGVLSIPSFMRWAPSFPGTDLWTPKAFSHKMAPFQEPKLPV